MKLRCVWCDVVISTAESKEERRERAREHMAMVCQSNPYRQALDVAKDIIDRGSTINEVQTLDIKEARDLVRRLIGCRGEPRSVVDVGDARDAVERWGPADG